MPAQFGKAPKSQVLRGLVLHAKGGTVSAATDPFAEARAAAHAALAAAGYQRT